MIDEPSQHSPVELDLLDVQVGNLYWAQIERRIGPVFARSDALSRARSYLAGLLSPAERKKSWHLAEISGHPNPYGFQHLLGRADWDADVLRDTLRTYVTDYRAELDAVGVIDESGLLKKGIHSAAVARHYSGSAGRLENCQIGVFLAYASDQGQTLLDRDLYLPKAWTEDRERCRPAGLPDERAFATTPVLARQMLERSFTAGVVLAGVTGDSVSGDDWLLRHWLEQRKQASVLAVSGKDSVGINHEQRQIKAIVADLAREGWETLSAGLGSKGRRWYDWQRRELSDPPQEGWKRRLLLRRSISEPSEVTASLAFARRHSTRVDQLRVAGMRSTVEESSQCAKGELGLDQYELRSWTGWYRHMTLAMWAQAFLTGVRAETGAEAAPKKGCGIGERQAVWQRSKPSASSRPAKLCRDPAAVLAVGLGCRAQRSGTRTLVMVAALASGLGAVVALPSARWEGVGATDRADRAD
jgi:SRSO17 transposase